MERNGPKAKRRPLLGARSWRVKKRPESKTEVVVDSFMEEVFLHKFGKLLVQMHVQCTEIRHYLCINFNSVASANHCRFRRVCTFCGGIRGALHTGSDLKYIS